MLKSKSNWLKRSLSLMLAVVMLMSMSAVNVFAEGTEQTTQNMTEKYTIPIASLVSAAPLEPVKVAFAKAFGASVVVTVNADGTKTALIKNHHMVIDLFGSLYDANVATIVDADKSTTEIESATILSTKQEVYTAGMGATEGTPITVPDEFTIPLNLDTDNAQKLSITVDFMDAFLGGGEPYPTTVTLTLDMANAVLDTTELKTLADQYRTIELANYTDSTVSSFNTALANADAIVANGGTYADANACYVAIQEAYVALAYKTADYTKVDDAIAKIPSDLSGYTYKSVDALETAVDAVDRSLTIVDQSKVDEMAVAIETAITNLEKALVSSEGKYIVPIKSLTSAAPLPPVQVAFAGAFGDTVTVIVKEDGTKVARIKNQHMVVDMSSWGMSKYDANVVTIVDADKSTSEIESATILSTKQEVFSNPNGDMTSVPVQTDITVPDEFEIPLNLDDNGSQKISITVDFMDHLMGGGNPYPTTVTLTLDMDAAVIDVSDLEALIEECEAITAENYTEESFAALTTAITKAKGVAANPETVENLNAMIAELNDVKDCLKYKGADYTAVDAAIAKIPADSTIYTVESWAAVETAKNAVVNGLDITKQETVNGYATAIETAVSGLVLKDADYSLVDQAIASVPSDMSKYTNESVKKVNDAAAAVERGLKADKQTEVNAMATAITEAVAALQEKSTDSSDDKIDIANLEEGTYEIPVALWHATQDKASMAAASFNDTARIVVKNGEKTVYIYTKPMTFGAITASLQEMKVEQADGTWVNAVVETKSSDGNPTCFSFTLDELSQYVNAKVNPHVEMMGNQDLDARLKFDLASIKIVSEGIDEKPLTPPADTDNNTQNGNNTDINTDINSPQTGDNSNLVLWFVLLIASAGAIVVLTFVNKRRTTFNR